MWPRTAQYKQASLGLETRVLNFILNNRLLRTATKNSQIMWC